MDGLEIDTGKSTDVNDESSWDETISKPTKIVVRRLPPSMTKEQFLELVSPLPEHDYFSYNQSENPPLKEFNFSRACINFQNIENVFRFAKKFDNLKVIDKAGREYRIIVEFAPFQRIHVNKKTSTVLEELGPIEDEPIYQQFTAKLDNETLEKSKRRGVNENYFDVYEVTSKNGNVMFDAQRKDRIDENSKLEVATTPLLEFLKSKRNDWGRYKYEKREERRKRGIERHKQWRDDTYRIPKHEGNTKFAADDAYYEYTFNIKDGDDDDDDYQSSKYPRNVNDEKTESDYIAEKNEEEKRRATNNSEESSGNFFERSEIDFSKYEATKNKDEVVKLTRCRAKSYQDERRLYLNKRKSEETSESEPGDKNNIKSNSNEMQNGPTTSSTKTYSGTGILDEYAKKKQLRESRGSGYREKSNIWRSEIDVIGDNRRECNSESYDAIDEHFRNMKWPPKSHNSENKGSRKYMDSKRRSESAETFDRRQYDGAINDRRQESLDRMDKRRQEPTGYVDRRRRQYSEERAFEKGTTKTGFTDPEIKEGVSILSKGQNSMQSTGNKKWSTNEKKNKLELNKTGNSNTAYHRSDTSLLHSNTTNGSNGSTTGKNSSVELNSLNADSNSSIASLRDHLIDEPCLPVNGNGTSESSQGTSFETNLSNKANKCNGVTPRNDSSVAQGLTNNINSNNVSSPCNDSSNELISLDMSNSSTAAFSRKNSTSNQTSSNINSGGNVPNTKDSSNGQFSSNNCSSRASNHSSPNKTNSSNDALSRKKLTKKLSSPKTISSNNEKFTNDSSTEQSSPIKTSCSNESSSKDSLNDQGSSQCLKEKPLKEPSHGKRIKNKDRPALEIYRPGMGKYSRQRFETSSNNYDEY